MLEQSIEQIRAELTSVLASPDLDFDKVVELSTELAKRDPDSVRFTTDAAIISRLGRELVAKQETAVAELIKNAYDADATQVTLTFIDSESPGGVLEIVDDGTGMNRDQLIDGFMRLSSTEKLNHPHSPRFMRRRAGRKGIGRFAVQRLGSELTVTTQTAEENIALRVVIHWDEFEAGRDLTSVSSRVEGVSKSRREGTSLRIARLREAWSEAAIRRVYRFVSELLQPFPLHTARQTTSVSGKLIDPGFKVTLSRTSGGQTSIVADESISVFSHALAEIEAYVDANGSGVWSLRSDKLSIFEPATAIGSDRDRDEIPYSSLRDVSLKAYYFIWEATLIPRTMMTTIRDMAREKGGIRVYRNGFRVMPYGEREDDWLGLDESTRARAILPPHANNNFFGFVEIVDPEGTRFEETSSREGLLENQAFHELQDFTARVLKAAALRIAEVRGRKGTASQRNWARENRETGDSLREIAERLTAAVGTVGAATGNVQGRPSGNPSSQESNPLVQTVAQVAEELQRTAAATDEMKRQLIEEIGMLRVLASLGLVIGEFTHEVKQILGAAHLSARHLMESLEGETNYETAKDLYENVQRFRTYASYFYSAIAENTTRELIPQDLGVVVREFVKSAKPSAERAGIALDTVIEGYDLISPPMHASEIASILFNFYSNSQKAIKRANAPGRILIKVAADESHVAIEFADNGDGIPQENQDRIFNPFFTTSTPTGPSASEEEEMQGTGLGLKIVRDIVESYGGEVYVAAAPQSFSTCLRVELPKGTPEEDFNDD